MSENTKKVDVAKLETEYKKTSQMGEVFKRLRRNKTAMLGLVVVIFLLLLAVFADVLHDYDTQIVKQNIPNRLQSPSSEHWFGTDEMGRDIFARVMYGAKYSLLIGFVAAIISLAIGLVLGALAGYYGGWIDMIVMRLMDVLLAIPGTLLAIAIMASLGSSIPNLIIALSVSGIPGFSRIVRSSVLTVKDSEYIEAAHAIGAKDSKIIFGHVLPNGMAPLIVQSTLRIGSVILTIAGLSFLGLGVPAPHPEWGAMLSNARAYIRDNSYMCLFPGLAIMTTILSLNLLGDGLRDALDPRLK